MSVKILVLDIDGTLVNSKKEITKGVKQAVIKAQQKGVKVVIASGRATFGVMPLALELEFDKYGGYVLAFNGGRIINCKTQEVMYEKMLPMELVPQIYQQAKKHDVGIITYDDSVICEDAGDKYVQIEAKLLKMPVKVTGCLLDYIDKPINKMLMIGDGEKLAILEPKLQEHFGSKLNIFRSEPYFLEFMPPDVDKAQSLARLIEILGIKREELMAIGDGFNDLSMIKFAGVGVAMANAQQQVKDFAEYITLSNEEDGVAAAIEKFIL